MTTRNVFHLPGEFQEVQASRQGPVRDMATDFRLRAVSWPKLYHFSAFKPKSCIVFWPNLWADMPSIIRRLTSQKTFPSASSWAVHCPHMVLHSRSHSQHSLIFLLLSHVRRALALGADRTNPQSGGTNSKVCAGLWRCTGYQRSPGRTYTAQEERSGSLSQLLNHSHTSAQNQQDRTSHEKQEICVTTVSSCKY